MKKQFIVIILIITIVFNFCIPNSLVYAEDETRRTTYEDTTKYTEKEFNKYSDEGKAAIGESRKEQPLKVTPNTPSVLATVLVNLLLIIPATIGSLVALVANLVIGANADGVNGKFEWVTVKDICFGNVNILNINYFDNTSGQGIMNDLKSNVATWYYALRNLSIIMLLCILIYIGIRMSLATIGEDNAKYKKMFIAWLKSFILIFFIHIIIATALLLVDNFIDLLRPIVENASFEGNIEKEITGQLSASGWGVVMPFIMYCFLTFIMLRFFLLYMRRMIVVGFLIIISPIVIAMYSIDTIKDNKAQTYIVWFQELMVNIFIQPLHALLYIVFFLSANEIASQSPFIAIAFLMSLSRGEKIVKDLFGLRGRKTINSMTNYMKIG